MDFMIDFILAMLGILMVIILDGCLICIFIWLVLSANVVIPAFNNSENKVETATTTYISNLSKEVLPIFVKYVPDFKFDKK